MYGELQLSVLSFETQKIVESSPFSCITAQSDSLFLLSATFHPMTLRVPEDYSTNAENSCMNKHEVHEGQPMIGNASGRLAR